LIALVYDGLTRIGEAAPMTDAPEEMRRRIEEADTKFYEQVSKRADPYRALAFEYEKLTTEFTHKGFQSLTYLNGGALVAIPTAMAFFKADVGRIDILWTASAFIVGLLCVVFAQVAAFFTMSSRAESATFHWSEQWQKIAAHQFRYPSDERTAHDVAAGVDRANALKRTSRSNIWRIIGLVFFLLSLAAFLAGCLLGGWAVILAKEAATR
jgi:hypothetical protein